MAEDRLNRSGDLGDLRLQEMDEGSSLELRDRLAYSLSAARGCIAAISEHPTLRGFASQMDFVRWRSFLCLGTVQTM